MTDFNIYVDMLIAYRNYSNFTVSDAEKIEWKKEWDNWSKKRRTSEFNTLKARLILRGVPFSQV